MTPRLIAYLVAAAALIGALFVVNGWRKDSNELPKVQATLTQERATYAEQARIRKSQDDITNKAGNDRENAIQDLRQQLIDAHNSIPRVSLHKCPSVPASAPTSSPASLPDGPSKDRPDTADESPDLGPALLDIAAEAANCGNQLNLLQQWVRDQASVH